MNVLRSSLIAGLAVFLAPQVYANGYGIIEDVTEAEAVQAQQGWCQALLDISSTYEQRGHEAARELAGQIIDAAYAYDTAAVLFKPTLTTVPQTFRTTRDGALSYFVGGDPSYPGDSGFALKGWTACEIENASVFTVANSATTMGKVHFTNAQGEVTSVDKTWQFVKDEAGQLRIITHHSSLEFSGN